MRTWKIFFVIVVSLCPPGQLFRSKFYNFLQKILEFTHPTHHNKFLIVKLDEFFGAGKKKYTIQSTFTSVDTWDIFTRGPRWLINIFFYILKSFPVFYSCNLFLTFLQKRLLIWFTYQTGQGLEKRNFFIFYIFRWCYRSEIFQTFIAYIILLQEIVLL